jgi:hypothetical protein
MAAWNQDQFAVALVDRSLPLPPGLTSWNAGEPQQRFGVYRGNVAGALIEALAVRYPVVQRLVGEDFFRAMARDYALANLPASPVLIHYGADFPDFIASFAPAATLSYLPDVARLESANWMAYHAADATPLAANDFAALDPSKLAGVRLTFLPSVHVLSSAYPIFSIWRTNTEDAEVEPVDLTQAEDVLVSRPDMKVDMRKLPSGAATFLSALIAGQTLGEAAALALAHTPEFDLAFNIAGLISLRIAAGITP